MNIFEDGFEEPGVKFPDKIFTELTKGFSTATKNLADLRLIEVSGVGRLATSALLDKMFRFKVVLISEYLPDYSFEVLEFGYDVGLFPVAIDIEEGIGKELKVKQSYEPYYFVSCDIEVDFEKKLNEIFASSRFKKTVGGLMKIARVKRED